MTMVSVGQGMQMKRRQQCNPPALPILYVLVYSEFCSGQRTSPMQSTHRLWQVAAAGHAAGEAAGDAADSTIEDVAFGGWLLVLFAMAKFGNDVSVSRL